MWVSQSEESRSAKKAGQGSATPQRTARSAAAGTAAATTSFLCSAFRASASRPTRSLTQQPRPLLSLFRGKNEPRLAEESHAERGLAYYRKVVKLRGRRRLPRIRFPLSAACHGHTNNTCAPERRVGRALLPIPEEASARGCIIAHGCLSSLLLRAEWGALERGSFANSASHTCVTDAACCSQISSPPSGCRFMSQVSAELPTQPSSEHWLPAYRR